MGLLLLLLSLLLILQYSQYWAVFVFPEKQIDLANTNLKKLRVNELKKILSVWGEDNACKGCMEKSDYIKEIERLMPKYDPEAHKKRQEKSELWYW